jgi:hypothetical protein
LEKECDTFTGSMDEDAVKNEFQHELLDKEWMVNIEFI